ncbi:hypothetical protein ACLMNJ_01830 [Streptomyces seoulensis]
MHLPSRVARLLAVAALPLVLAACGSSGTSDSSGPAAPSGPSGPSGSSGSGAGPAAAAGSAPKDPDAGLLTGARLKRALAPASAFPAGFAVDPDAARDSGDTFAPAASATAAEHDCARLDGTGWIEITGIAGASFAQNDYADRGATQDVAQEIDAYRGDGAAWVLAGLAEVVAACSGFQDADTHSKVTVTGRATPGLGDGAYTVTLTDDSWENGTTLVAARVGHHVVSVLSTAGHDNGAATARALAERLVGSVRGAL